MKRIIVLVPFFLMMVIPFANFYTVAQKDLPKRFKPKIILDTAYMEIIYVHIIVDPVLKEREVKYEMLSVGENFHHYGGYGDYQLDSMLRIDPQLMTIAPTFEDYRSLSRSLERVITEMTLNNKDSVIKYYDKSFINYFRYEEPIPEINWTLKDSVEEVMGYNCNEATAIWRGRTWTAWYSDIPVDGGPWKFQGLPGLILKLEDDKKEHIFEAIGLRNEKFPLGYHQALYSKTTREKLNELKKEDKWHIGRQLVQSGMVTPQSEEEREFLWNRRLFYNPIELE